MRLPPLLLVAATLACVSDPPPPPPAGQPEPPGLLHQGSLWNRPEGSSFGTSACLARSSLPGCEEFVEWNLQAVAVDGQRLAVVISGRTYRDSRGPVLVLSEDLGRTARRFPLAEDLGHVSLQLRAGRIFLLASIAGVDPRSRGPAVLELDPASGILTDRGTMSAHHVTASGDGSLTSVDFARDRPPQVIAVTRLDPRSGRIERTELPCNVAGCDPASLSRPFLSSDGDMFDLLSDDPNPDGPSCLLTVGHARMSVRSECFPRLPARDRWPVSSVDGRPFDFQLSGAYDDPEVLLSPVKRHWLPAEPAVRFPARQLQPTAGEFLVFSPSGFTDLDDGRLVRVREDGRLEATAVPHQGCLELSRLTPRDCPRAVAIQQLPGDELLLVTQRDEFQDEARSRQLFEVLRVQASFSAFQP